MMRSVVALGFLAVVSGCATEGDVGDEDESGETEDQLLAGRRVPVAELAQLLRANSVPERDVHRLVCAARYESNYYEKALNNRNRNGTSDYGVFQINSVHVGTMSGCPSTRSALYSAEVNTKCAAAVYRAQGINAWNGYKSHRSTCDAYRVPGGSSPAPSSQPEAPESGDCYSATLGSRVDSGECVQASKNSKWYQCVDGYWVGASSSSGPKGACTASHPL